MKTTFGIALIALLVATPLVAFAQEAEAPEAPVEAPARKVDAAAMKLIDAAKAKIYSPVADGLKSMACVVSIAHPQMPFELKFDSKFVTGGESTIKMRDLPPEMAPMAGQMEQQFKGLVKNMFVDSCAGGFSEIDKYHVEMKNDSIDTIVLTGMKDDALGQKSEIVFGENGIPSQYRNSGAQGEMTYKPVYVEKEGKFLLQSATITTMGGEMSMQMTHKKVGKFWFTSTVSMAGLMITASEIKTDPAAKVEETPTKPDDVPGDDR